VSDYKSKKSQLNPVIRQNAVTIDELKKSDFLVMRKNRTGDVKRVIAPNTFQVGMTDSRFHSDFLVTGAITGSIIYAPQGFSGSLTKLVDGTDYLRAGSNITLTHNENGSIQIAASGFSNNALTAGNGIDFSSGTTYDGASAKTISLDLKSGGGLKSSTGELEIDINGTSTAAAIATNDQILIYDVTAAALKKVTVSDVRGSGGIDINSISSTLTDSDFDDDNYLAVTDGNDSNITKKIKFEDLMEYAVAGTSYGNSGIRESSGRLYVDIGNLSGAVINPSEDYIAFSDESAFGDPTKKESVSDFVDAIRGTSSVTGLNSSAGVLQVDINSLSTTTVDPANDQVMIYDADASAIKKVSINDLSVGGAPADAQYVVLASDGQLTNESVLTGGNGISVSSATISADLKGSGGLVIDAGKIKIDYGNTAGQAAQGSNTLEIVAGDGIAGGGTFKLGDATSSTTITVNSEEIKGKGVSVEGNNMNVYLKAGANVSITTGSENEFVITSTDTNTDTQYTAGIGLALTGVDFSLDVNELSALGSTASTSDYVVIEDVTDNSTKKVLISNLPGTDNVIGAAEAGDDVYTDGLFTDFTATTPTGTAVDRFNEVLKLLVPTPAPDLDDIDVNTDGVEARLSFGTSNDQSSATPAYTSVAASAGIASAVDVNGTYSTATSSNNYRAAVINGSTDLIGDLNEDVAADITSPSNVTNYPVNSFGNANANSLILEVNGADLYTLNLAAGTTGTGAPGSGTKSHVNGNGSGFINVSVTADGKFDNGTSFPQFRHRTGQWKVTAADMRNGWNYARVKHGSVVTNYIEWVRDPDGTTLSTSGNTLNFSGGGTTQLSGITYFSNATAQYQVAIDNNYKYVYGTGKISFTGSVGGLSSNSSFGISPINIPTITGGQDHTKQISVSQSGTVTTTGYILGGSITMGCSLAHPLKADLSNSAQTTASNILMYNISESPSDTNEIFVGEANRLQTNAFNQQTDVSGGSYNWNSAQSLVGGSAGHNTGLQVYRERLYSPKNTLNSGNFSGLSNGPGGNPNYSGITGEKTYYRKFKNTTGGNVRDLSYSIAGNGTLINHAGSVGSNDKFKLYFKMPSDGGTDTTGWLDANTQFSYNNVSDNSGCGIGSIDDSLGITNNHATFGTVEVANNEFVVAKIVAHSNWSGYLDNFSVSFGATGAVAVNNPAATLDINETTGVTAKLSFGDTLTPGSPGYSPVENTAGNAEKNENQTYTKNTSSRIYGIFGGNPASKDITGDINFDKAQSSPANAYPQYSFGAGNAHLGTLKLFVNGAEKHSIDLTSLTSFTNDFGSGGSGFPNISAVNVGKDANNLPDYRKFWRTGNYKIAYADQRNGWNYARVVHHDGTTAHNTAYVEWINDYSNPTISFSGVSVGNFAAGSTYDCSGIKYFINPTGRFDFTVANAYKYVYSPESDAISFPTTDNCTITNIAWSGDGITNSNANATSAAMPGLLTSVSDSFDDNLTIQATFTVDGGTSIPGESSEKIVTVKGDVKHPIKTGPNQTSSTSSGKILMANFTDNSTVLSEPFNGEAKRLRAGNTTYSNQAAVYTGGSFAYPWNPATNMETGDAAHNTGLIVYDGKLRSPQKVGLSGDLGDFRNVSEGGQLVSANGNPDYSSLTNSTREYIRYFQNNTGGSKTDFTVAINGTGTIVSNVTALSGNNVRVFFKLPTGAAGATGWMDMALDFATGQNGDNAGCRVGSFDSSLDATNNITFGTQSVANGEYILIKVVADKTWTGNISQIGISWT